MLLDDDVPEEAMLNDLIRSNKERIEALARRGYQLELKGREAAMLEFLLAELVGKTPERIAFETRWHTLIAEQIDQADKVARNDEITRGVASNPHIVTQISRSKT